MNARLKSNAYHFRPLLEALEPRRLLTSVTGEYPIPNSHDAPVTTDVSAVFDADIDPATVSAETFAVHGMQTGQILESLSVNGDTVALSPTAPFHPGELVEATLTNGIEDLGGEPMANPFVWHFRTEVGVGNGLGTGLFTDSGQGLGDSQSRAVALGDVDGDGDLDAFIGRGSLDVGLADEVWLNDGSGTFADSAQMLGDSGNQAVALGDVDGDGDLDAFVGNHSTRYSSGANKVWLNDGSFSESGQSLGDSPSNSVALGDLDGDGDLDAFVANDGPNKTWLNDGSGTFANSGQSIGSYESGAVALGDVDGDCDLDAVVGNSHEPNKVWLNDGNGSFTDSGQSLGDVISRAVALGDVDGDGDLDAVIGNSHEPNRVWRNDGSGNFSDSGQSLDGSGVGDALGDVDGDGDLDAFVGNSVWLNDGNGSFTDSGQFLNNPAGTHAGTFATALGDVDGDGDLDAFNVPWGGGPIKVWLNQDALPGDFDNDQDVDGNDFLIWQAGFGMATGATRYDGDADFNGTVDGDDFLIWQANFGTGATAGGGSAVPATRSNSPDRPDSTTTRDEAVDKTFAELDRVSARWAKRSLRDELVDELTLFK